MPGSSLWLVPPKDHPLHSTLSLLIDTIIPAQFPGIDPPKFVPHVTLTSLVPPERYQQNAQQWLQEELEFPAADDVNIKFTGLNTEDFFFRKLTIPVQRDQGLMRLAAECRKVGVIGPSEEGASSKAQQWVENDYGPHNSLMYADVPISDEQRKELERVVEEAAVDLSGRDETGGWKGGVVWLVSTEKPIAEWQPIATRPLT